MSTSRIYVNSQNRTDKSDNPQSFKVQLNNPVEGVENMELASATIEAYWKSPTLAEYETAIKFTTPAIEFTVDTFKLYKTPSDLVTELNTLYNTESGGSESPFSYDSSTMKISITLGSSFTIDPTVTNSLWERLGYSYGDNTTSTLVGANHILSFSSSPNMARTSLIYVGVDKIVNDSTGSGVNAPSDIIAVVPLQTVEYAWIHRYDAEAILNNKIRNTRSSFSDVRVTLYDDKYQPLLLQPNAMVALQLNLTHHGIDIDGDGVIDRGIGHAFYPLF